MEMYNKYQFIGCESDYLKATKIIFGAPFDGTSSFRPGSRFAPSKVRIDSYALETYSPYLNLDLEDIKIHDAGDLEFPFGNTKKVLDIIDNFVSTVYDSNKKPLMIGGEHLVSLPAISAAYKKHNDLVVLHFDAHTDLREDYLGEKYSHATVMKRVWDLLSDDRIYQFGIRSGLREEFEWSSKGHTFINKFSFNLLDDVIKKTNDKPVYITIDLDILDPSIFPGTGTPEPGGISFNDMITIIKKISSLNIVGADIVELSPDYDTSGVSTAVACKIIREMLLIL